MSRKKKIPTQPSNKGIQYHLKEYAITRIEFDAAKLTLVPTGVTREEGVYQLETGTEFNKEASVILIKCKVGAGFLVDNEPVIIATIETRTDIHVTIEDHTWFGKESVSLPAQFVQHLISNSITSLRGTIRTVLGLCNVTMSPIPFVILPLVSNDSIVEVGFTQQIVVA